jgi:hypothetical protein
MLNSATSDAPVLARGHETSYGMPHALDPDHCPHRAAILVPLVSASGLGIAHPV